MPDEALATLGMTLADRIGGGWPQPEVERCDACGVETPNLRRRILASPEWLCRDCYRRSVRAQPIDQATLEGWA